MSQEVAEAAHRSLLEALDRLADEYGLLIGPARVIAEFDERGVVASLTFGEGDAVDTEFVVADIERAIANRVPARMAADPRLIESFIDRLDRGRVDRFANDLRSVTVNAVDGVITSVRLDPRLLGGARPQTICDEVLPVARRAILAAGDSTSGGAR